MPYQKIRRIRNLRPDMILLAGGTDGGDSSHVMEIAELIKASEPKPRLGIGYELPIVYAGNKALRPQIVIPMHTGLFLPHVGDELDDYVREHNFLKVHSTVVLPKLGGCLVYTPCGAP